MGRKIAAASSLLVFAVAILLGLDAQNTFATTVWRALVAMGGTFIVGLVIGAMAEKMANEAETLRREKSGKSSEDSAPADR